MVSIIIIALGILFFYWVLKIGGFLDNKKSQPQQQSRPTLTYSSRTIRDTPKPRVKEAVVKTLDLPDDNKTGIFESKIAGISLRCTEADKGIFHGIIYNEDNNPYNSKAMAIVSLNKKLIGYIPENELKDYYDWCNGIPVTCVGFIKSFVNERGAQIVFGKVYAIKPCNTNFVESVTCELDEEIERNEHLSTSRV